MIWVINCYEKGMKDQTMKSLARAGAEGKKSIQYEKFTKMQLSEDYIDETRVMNKAQEYIIPNWIKLARNWLEISMGKRSQRMPYYDWFNDDTFEKNTEEISIFIRDWRRIMVI
jgi:hypothetical protein